MSNKKAILFIDGSNLYHCLKVAYIHPGEIDFSKLCHEICKFYKVDIKKVYYYNSIPSIRDGQDLYYKHIKFLEGMKKIPLFEVKTRKLQRHSTSEIIEDMHSRFDSLNLCKTCLPLVKSSWIDYVGKIQTKEKGIDVMIAIDMFNKMLIEKEGDCCILVSGDADFLPCLDIIHSKDIMVCSASPAKGYSFDLRNKYPFFILDSEFLKEKCFKDSLK